MAVAGGSGGVGGFISALCCPSTSPPSVNICRQPCQGFMWRGWRQSRQSDCFSQLRIRVEINETENAFGNIVTENVFNHYLQKKYIIAQQRGSLAVSQAHVTTSECCTLSHLHSFSAPDSSEVCRLSSHLASVGSCCKAANCPTANHKVWQWADEKSLSREMRIFEVGGQAPNRRRGSAWLDVAPCLRMNANSALFVLDGERGNCLPMFQ